MKKVYKRSSFLIIPLFFICVNSQVKNDTIFIKNDKSQKIFIESNRDSDYYKYLDDFKNFKITKNYSNIMNQKWIRIYNYNSGYFLYAPCDWTYDTKIIIDRKYLQIKNSEISHYKIKHIKKKNDEILVKYSDPYSPKKLNLKIIPIDKKLGIYRFIFEDSVMKVEYMMIQAQKNKNFDIIVNDCKYEKTKEFEFDKE